MNEKDLKKEIRKLRKLKLQCKVGCRERILLHRQIRELKRELNNLNKIEPEKEIIINEILKKETSFKEIFDKIYYNKFNIEELKKHLERLNNKED